MHALMATIIFTTSETISIPAVVVLLGMLVAGAVCFYEDVADWWRDRRLNHDAFLRVQKKGHGC